MPNSRGHGRFVALPDREAVPPAPAPPIAPRHSKPEGQGATGDFAADSWLGAERIGFLPDDGTGFSTVGQQGPHAVATPVQLNGVEAHRSGRCRGAATDN